MKILSVKKENNAYAFAVELDFAAWKKEFAAAKSSIAKNIQIPGFRKGKVPAKLIDEKITPAQVAYQALEKNQTKYIEEIIKSKEFEKEDCIDSVCGLDVTKIDADKSAPQLVIKFDAVPKVLNFTAKDIKEIVVPEFKKPELPEAFIKSQAKAWLKQDAMIANKDGAIAKGDIAVIDFKGFVDGKPFAGGEGKNYELEIGSKSFVDNFEDQLIGLKKGDKKDVNVTFPKDYQKDLAGKAAKFEVVVNNVKTIEYPEVNKEYLANKQIEGSTMADLEKHIAKIYTESDEYRYEEVAKNIIDTEIIKKTNLDFYPNNLLNSYAQRAIQLMLQQARCKNVEQYKKQFNYDDAKFTRNVTEVAKNLLKISMVYENLIKEYNIEATKADFDEEIKLYTRYFKDAAQAQKLVDLKKDEVEQQILIKKLTKKMVAEAKKEDPKKIEESKKINKVVEKAAAAAKIAAKK